MEFIFSIHCLLSAVFNCGCLHCLTLSVLLYVQDDFVLLSCPENWRFIGWKACTRREIFHVRGHDKKDIRYFNVFHLPCINQIQKLVHKLPTKCFLIFTTYFIHNILTNMFRPVFLPSSGLCSYYKNTVVVNCVTVTAQ